jgi:hypothetical protein
MIIKYIIPHSRVITPVIFLKTVFVLCFIDRQSIISEHYNAAIKSGKLLKLAKNVEINLHLIKICHTFDHMVKLSG